MNKTITHKLTLNHSHLFSLFEDVILKHFDKLSDDFVDILLTAEVLRHNAVSMISFKGREGHIFDNLATDIDCILSEEKYEIIRRLKQSISSHTTNDVISLEIAANIVSSANQAKDNYVE